MDISTLESNRFAAISDARQNIEALQRETSSRTGGPLAATPSDEQLVNSSPLNQLLQQIDGEITLATAAASAANVSGNTANNTANVQNSGAANAGAANSTNTGSNNANAGSDATIVHDAFGRFNIVA